MTEIPLTYAEVFYIANVTVFAREVMDAVEAAGGVETEGGKKVLDRVVAAAPSERAKNDALIGMALTLNGSS